MKDLKAALRSLCRRFEQEGIPFAVIGAMAVRQHGHERFTEDVDILTTPDGLRRIHEAFGGRGLNPRAPGLRKSLVDSEHEVQIDVITAGEPAGAAGSPVLYPDPSGPGFEKIDGITYPTLDKLVEFKLASSIWGKRIHDLADVVKLIQVNRLDVAFAERLHPGVRPKFLEAHRMAQEEIDRRE